MNIYRKTRHYHFYGCEWKPLYDSKSIERGIFNRESDQRRLSEKVVEEIQIMNLELTLVQR